MAVELGGIEKLLAGRIGLDPLSVGSVLIWRAAKHRMKDLGLVDIEAYEYQVRHSESELQELVEEVVVSESWFFRDALPFEHFREHVRAKWLSNQLRPPLRILSLACAGGEEPYSVAMTLHDMKLPIGRFQIDAVDISARRLAFARRGVYSANAFRGSDLSYRTRYFHDHSGGYELDSSICSTVRYVQANILDPGLLEGSPPYDAVFCRNLLIYLGVPARVSVLATIERLLTADGLLFIGHADRLDIAGKEAKFIAAGDPGGFVYRLRTHDAILLPRQALEALEPVSSCFLPANMSSGANTFTTIDSTKTTSSVLNTPMAATATFPDNEPPLLDQAAALANQGRFDDAIAVCERHLKFKGFSSPAYYLLGMICQAAGNRQRAEECFHKTVYLDPMHDEALLALALLAERRGDQSAALTFRRRAERSVTMSRKRVN